MIPCPVGNDKHLDIPQFGKPVKKQSFDLSAFSNRNPREQSCLPRIIRSPKYSAAAISGAALTISIER
jgi:hypothetical protein